LRFYTVFLYNCIEDEFEFFVSTLLEILLNYIHSAWPQPKKYVFQPFLRFYGGLRRVAVVGGFSLFVSTLLEILPGRAEGALRAPLRDCFNPS